MSFLSLDIDYSTYMHVCINACIYVYMYVFEIDDVINGIHSRNDVI